MKASIGDRVFVVLQGVRTDPTGLKIRPATVVRDWGEYANLKVDLDGSNDEMDAAGNPVMTRWLTSISPNAGGAPPGVDPKGTTIGNIGGYFFNLVSAEQAVEDYMRVMAAQESEAPKC